MGYSKKFFLSSVLISIVLLALEGCKTEAGSPPTGDRQNQNGGLPGGTAGQGSTVSTEPHIGEGGEGGSIGGPGGVGGTDGGNHDGFVTVHFSQNQFTSQYDFLWVVDNSGSMSNIRTFMSQNLNNFLSVLQSRRSLDWQMAVTNTDNVDTAGNLISSGDGTRVVSHHTANVTAVWASIISRIVGTSHSGWEQGLESGRSALSVYGSEFSRAGVPLVVAYVTDEEDYSCASNCYGFTGVAETHAGVIYHPVSRYTDQFQAYHSSNGADVLIYSIVHMASLGGPNACDDYGTMGTRYTSVQQGTGTGTSMSICPNDLAASFDQVAQLTANRGVCFTLSPSAATAIGMVVRVDGDLVAASSSNGYQYENGAVCFTGSYVPDNGSSISVYYRAIN